MAGGPTAELGGVRMSGLLSPVGVAISDRFDHSGVIPGQRLNRYG